MRTQNCPYPPPPPGSHSYVLCLLPAACSAGIEKMFVPTISPRADGGGRGRGRGRGRGAASSTRSTYYGLSGRGGKDRQTSVATETTISPMMAAAGSAVARPSVGGRAGMRGGRAQAGRGAARGRGGAVPAARGAMQRGSRGQQAASKGVTEDSGGRKPLVSTARQSIAGKAICTTICTSSATCCLSPWPTRTTIHHSPLPCPSSLFWYVSGLCPPLGSSAGGRPQSARKRGGPGDDMAATSRSPQVQASERLTSRTQHRARCCAPRGEGGPLWSLRRAAAGSS